LHGLRFTLSQKIFLYRKFGAGFEKPIETLRLLKKLSRPDLRQNEKAIETQVFCIEIIFYCWWFVSILIEKAIETQQHFFTGAF